MRTDPLLSRVCDLAREAGRGILAHYRTGAAVETKADQSPITAADRDAHRIICDGLSTLTPDIPVLSEETEDVDHVERRTWSRFWLVDPLDGTKEFIKGTDEFTVNIALIEGERASQGVLFAPALDDLYWAGRDTGAWRSVAGEPARPIRCRPADRSRLTVVASRSHQSKAVKALLARLPGAHCASMGSALKLCLVASGAADLYPRLGPTMEWDTGAAHCIVEVAGGQVVDTAGRPLRYNKEDLHNPFFICVGDPALDWRSLLPEAAG
ncbi:MAG: 3'(2'),5'-bisphosphate nucleotidase CysQ [Acidobacteriota bacterium]